MADETSALLNLTRVGYRMPAQTTRQGPNDRRHNDPIPFHEPKESGFPRLCQLAEGGAGGREFHPLNGCILTGTL